ncbi:MAG: GDSL-type esterase/lipase family protein [bacterium]
MTLRSRLPGLLALAALAALAVPLASRVSLHASVLGRYSPAYATFLALYGLLLCAATAVVFGASERRYRAVFGANLLLLVMSTGVALGIAEFGLRAVAARDARFKRYPKNLVTRMSSPEYDVEIATNRDGFRDTNHAARAPRGTTRIAVIGDSFVWGAGVAFPEIMTSRLEQILGESGTPAEVMNFGVTGTGPRSYMRVWEGAVRRYRPDVVVAAFYAGNDLSDAVKEARAAAAPRPRSALVAAIGRLLHRDAPAPRTTLGWAAEGIENPLERSALFARGLAAGIDSATIAARLAAIPESLVAQAREFRINPFNFAEAILDPESIRKNLLLMPSEEATVGWPAAERALDDLAADVARTGARFALVAFPPAVQVDSTYWWIRQAGFRLDERVVAETPLQDRLAEFARDRRILYCDLLPALRARAGERLFFEQDGHWTRTGNDVAARALADALGRH